MLKLKMENLKKTLRINGIEMLVKDLHLPSTIHQIIQDLNEFYQHTMDSQFLLNTSCPKAGI
jgi:hypothetical protein